MSSLRFNMTSSHPLRLHVDRGLRACVPVGPHRPGPRGPCQVELTYQKPHRPASGAGDLIRNPDDLGRLKKTLS
jgi:hypothetical protein